MSGARIFRFNENIHIFIFIHRTGSKNKQRNNKKKQQKLNNKTLTKCYKLQALQNLIPFNTNETVETTEKRYENLVTNYL